MLKADSVWNIHYLKSRSILVILMQGCLFLITPVISAQEPAATNAEQPGQQPAAEAADAVTQESPRFNVWEYRIEGNTLLDNGKLERSVYPYLGPDKTIDTVEAARKMLEQEYHNSGYGTVFVDIPEQNADAGIITLKVTESTIGQVRITGSRYYSLGRIRAALPALQEGTPPHLPDIQTQITALNRSGGREREVTPVMRPGKRSGTVDVDLNVKDTFPLHASLELNDRYTKDTTKTRLNATLRYSNLWQSGHIASLGYVVAPEDRDEVEVLFGTYSFRLPDSNRMLTFYAVDSSSDIVSGLDISQIGVGNIYGLRASLPLPGAGNYFHSFTLGADYKDFEESTRLLGEDGFNTPISYSAFTTIYSGGWSDDWGQTTIGLEGHFGLRAFGNTNAEFSGKRVGARPNFAFLKANIERRQKLFLGSSLLVRLEGQGANSPLISNEQYSIGGLDSVRGYLESQQVLDDGIAAALELHTPSYVPFSWLTDMHFVAFVDGARGRIQQALPDQINSYSLYSIGTALHMLALERLQLDAQWAVALKDNEDIERGDNRIHFRMAYEF